MQARTCAIRTPLNRPMFTRKIQEILAQKRTKVAFASAAMVMGLLYVVQMNITATKGYEIRKLEDAIASLQSDEQKLKLQSIELQSMNRVVDQLENYKLVKATPDAFYNTTGLAVATR